MRTSLFLLRSVTAAVLCATGATVFAAPAVPGGTNTVAGDAYWGGTTITASTPNAASINTPVGGWKVPGGSNTIAGDTYWGSTGEPPIYSTGTTWTKDDLQAEHLNTASVKAKAAVPRIRAEAIEDAAATFGTQAGLAHVAQQINGALQGKSKVYDQAFNFDAVELEPGFIPPVISEGHNAYNQPNANEVRAAKLIYKIEFPARLQNVPPRWQDYLMQPFSNPEQPHGSLLPKTDAEKALWNEWVNKGWDQGVQQAWDNFESSRGRLKRDFEGMVRFKSLYVQGLVDKPILARATLGVTGGQDQMAIDDRIVRITKPAQFNPDQKRWLKANPQ